MFGGVIATRLRGTFNDPVAGRLALFWIPGGIAAVGLLFAVRSVRSPRGLPLVLAVGLALAAAGTTVVFGCGRGASMTVAGVPSVQGA